MVVIFCFDFSYCSFEMRCRSSSPYDTNIREPKKFKKLFVYFCQKILARNFRDKKLIKKFVLFQSPIVLSYEFLFTSLDDQSNLDPLFIDSTSF